MLDILNTPPPSVILDGFYGEVSPSSFITYANLATLSGMTSGTPINSEAGWLKFILDQKELYVAKVNVRNFVSWNQINSVGCVFGTKVVTILGKRYKVRLLKGADSNPYSASHWRYAVGTRNSEWNRLFNFVVRDDVDVPIPPRNLKAPYTQAQLDMTGNKWYSHCQETPAGSPNARCNRGYIAMSTHAPVGSPDHALTNRAWRPCLELID